MWGSLNYIDVLAMLVTDLTGLNYFSACGSGNPKCRMKTLDVWCACPGL